MVNIFFETTVKFIMHVKCFRKHMSRWALIIAAAPPLLSVCAGDELSAYLVRHVDDRAELTWQEVTSSSSFLDYHKKEVAELQTRFHMVYDDQNLYLQVVCHEPDTTKIKAVCEIHDGAVWQDDCVEIFLDPDRSEVNYFQFVSNARGVRAEGRKDEDSTRFAMAWNGVWNVTARVLVDSWVIEVKIPFASLDVSQPKEGAVWGGNVCRERRSGNVFELSSWAPAKNFHQPRNFGWLVFESFGPELKRQFKQYNPRIEEYRQRTLKALQSQGIDSENDYRRRFECLKKEWISVIEQCKAVNMTSGQFGMLLEALPRLLHEYKNLAIELELEELFLERAVDNVSG